MLSLLCKYKCIFLLAISVILFGFSNAVTGWLLFLPVFFLVRYSKLKNCWIYGGLYGALAYSAFLPWLFNFSRIAMAGVCFLYFVYCSLLFIVLKMVDILLKDKAFVVFPFVVVLYEILKTVGFVGFGYGITGYTQWKNIFFIQISDFSGVYGVSFILVTFSSVLFNVFSNLIERKKICLLTKCSIAFVAFLIVFSYFYGFFKINKIEKRDSGCKTINIAAIQNNSDPWKGGIEHYEHDVKVLMELSDSAISENPDLDLIVWPETAVVPSIMENYFEPWDERRTALVGKLLEYINNRKCSFVIGNFHSEKNNDFNAAYFFIPGTNVIPPEPKKYYKNHLVPFTEFFPYDKQFPGLYKILLEGDTHLWTPGTEKTVFEFGDFKFSTPICFEDTFGYDCRKYVKNGAGAFINLSNDAWSKSKLCQKQHLQMAVFRSIENHVPTVRSTTSGQTCVISSVGKVLAEAKPFAEDFIIGAIPVFNP